jgi:hypothetical protein
LGFGAHNVHRCGGNVSRETLFRCEPFTCKLYAQKKGRANPALMFHVKQLTPQRGLRFVYVVAIGCFNIISQLACYASKVKAHRAIRYLDGVMVDIDSSHCALIFKADCWFCTHDHSPVLDGLFAG